MTKQKLFTCVALLGASAMAQQPSVPTEFAAEAKPLTAEALRARITDKVFKVALTDGTSWRLQYQSGGTYYVNTSRGFNGSGKWSVDGSKICSESQRDAFGCNEARLLGDTLYLKRNAAPGEVLKFEPN